MDLESTVKCFHQQVPNHTMNLAEYSYPPSSFKKERKGKNKRIQKRYGMSGFNGTSRLYNECLFPYEGKHFNETEKQSIINA